MRRLLVVLLLLVLVAPARADDPVLGADERAEIVQTLAEAAAAQGVCYGYRLDVNDSSGGGWNGIWTASNLGEDVDPRGDARCRQWVLLDAWINYTSSSSDSEDSSGWTIHSTMGGPTTDELKRLGLDSNDLTSDKHAGTTLFNAVLALPVLVADDGLAPPVPEDPTDASPAPSDARATGHPGSDWWRENGGAVALLIVGLALAGVWATTTTPTGHRRAIAVLKAMKD